MSQNISFLFRLYMLNVVYWVVAIVGLIARYFVAEIRVLTQYGGRIAPTSSSLMPSGTTDVEDTADCGEDAEAETEADSDNKSDNNVKKVAADENIIINNSNNNNPLSSGSVQDAATPKPESKMTDTNTRTTSGSSSKNDKNDSNSKSVRHPMIVMSDGSLRRLDWCPVALQPLVASTVNAMIGLARTVARMIESSYFGRTRIPRSDAFAVFYMFGLLGCMLMWKWTPYLPCEEVASRSVRAYFIRTENLYDAVPMDRTNAHNESDLQEMMRVFYRHGVNPDAVEQRYWYETNYCADEVAPLYYAESFPTLLFLLHCVIRLAECFYVHVFRCATRDTVNFFSFLAGCSFYLMAAVCTSFSLWSTIRYDMFTKTLVQEGLLPSWRSLPNASLYVNQVNETVNASQIELFSDWRMRKQAIFHNTTYAGFPASLVPRRIPLPWYLSTLEMVASKTPIKVLYTVIVFLFVLYMLVQIVQTSHHEILAQQRRLVVNKGARNRMINARIAHTASVVRALEVELAKHEITARRVAQHGDAGDVHLLDTSTSSNNNDKNDSSQPYAADGTAPAQHRHSIPALPKPEHTTGTDSRVLRYHLPSSLLFRWLLEPHYTCEIILYALNGALMLMFILFDVLVVPGAVAADCRVLSMYRAGKPGMTSSSPNELQSQVIHAVLLHLIAGCGVTLFTMFNLAITAQEHRQFWNYVNDERETISALVAADVAPVMATDAGGGEKSQSAVDEMKAVEATKRRQQLEFIRVLRPEILPSSNLIPGIW